MIGRPAAAAASSLDTIHGRLVDFVEGMPDTSGALLASALLPARARGPKSESASPRSGTTRNDFYWLLVPEWLAGVRDERLDDVLWAQYCLYCFFRAQDDVVDGDADDAHLAVAANLFVTEAARVLRRHLPAEGRFWDGYHDAIDSTSRALVAIDHRQASPSRDGETDPAHYARLSRCLTVATHAVLVLLGRESDWPRFSALLDHLAVAGQVLDDFHDMQSDLTSGQYNYAAWLMTRPVFGASVEATEAIIASNLATTDRLSEIFDRIDGELDAAGALSATGDPAELSTYLSRFRRTVHGLRDSLVARRDELFPSYPSKSDSPPASYTAPTIWSLDLEGTRDPGMG